MTYLWHVWFFMRFMRFNFEAQTDDGTKKEE